ncbi:hypothetical protein [Microbacterium yannicii]|uniref:hypothetical protein n=1 Tax=Microbacterium yannicii TaxID=671622 RepID=UPI0002E5A0C5|nr:hypothetical protein [Microbacterium yannicii]
MSTAVNASPPDLTGTVDERLAQLDRLAPESLDAQWLRRQLDAALAAWAADDTELDIVKDAHVDY